MPFKVVFAALDGVTRHYQRIQQMQDDIFMASTWGGVHFRNCNAVGEALGTKVGTHVLNSGLLRMAPQPAR
jgi:hypothetical protein